MNKLDAAFNFHQSALSLRAKRQELIAANIANADTPNYKARDIDFKASLNAVLHDKAPASAAMTTTSAQHLAGSSLDQQLSNALYRKEIQSSVDGNTVDMDVERNQFTDNAIRYEASLTFINGQIKKMMSAIQG